MNPIGSKSYFFLKPLRIKVLYELIFLGIEIANLRATEKVLNHI
jgi:hypothetical protein